MNNKYQWREGYLNRERLNDLFKPVDYKTYSDTLNPSNLQILCRSGFENYIACKK